MTPAGSSSASVAPARGCLVPRVGVLPVVELLRELRQPQRMERVAHDGQLVRLGHPDRLLREPGLRPVRDARRMQRHGADLDPLARPELAVDVIDHLLGVQVRVVVRDRDRLRVEVELARAERADHEVLALEGLVRGRRHVDAPRDRLEVVDRERPRVDVAVPAHDVERVVVEDVGLVAVADAHLDLELAALAVRLQLGRRVDVAVVVGRVLEQLPVLVAVAPRDLDQPGRLEDEVALRRPRRREAVRRAARDDDVVAVACTARRRRSSPACPRPRGRRRPRRPRRCGRSPPSRAAGRQNEISTSLFHISSRRPLSSSPSGSRPQS